MNVQPLRGRQEARLVTGAHSYFFIMLWQSRDGLKEADWDIDFHRLDFHRPWSFCTPLSPPGSCCYRNLAGLFNCLYWDADTFRLFPSWKRASQKVFLVTWDLDKAGRRHSQSLYSPSLQDCSPFSDTVYPARKSANSTAAWRSTYQPFVVYF